MKYILTEASMPKWEETAPFLVPWSSGRFLRRSGDNCKRAPGKSLAFSFLCGEGVTERLRSCGSCPGYNIDYSESGATCTILKLRTFFLMRHKNLIILLLPLQRYLMSFLPFLQPVSSVYWPCQYLVQHSMVNSPPQRGSLLLWSKALVHQCKVSINTSAFMK